MFTGLSTVTNFRHLSGIPEACQGSVNRNSFYSGFTLMFL